MTETSLTSISSSSSTTRSKILTILQDPPGARKKLIKDTKWENINNDNNNDNSENSNTSFDRYIKLSSHKHLPAILSTCFSQEQLQETTESTTSLIIAEYLVPTEKLYCEEEKTPTVDSSAENLEQQQNSNNNNNNASTEEIADQSRRFMVSRIFDAVAMLDIADGDGYLKRLDFADVMSVSQSIADLIGEGDVEDLVADPESLQELVQVLHN